MRREEGTKAADVATMTLQLAVLLESGAIPERVFSHIAEATQGESLAGESARRIGERIAHGENAADALELEGEQWVWIACAWRIARAVGAPLSPALRSMASVAIDSQEAADDVQIALAEPASTARLMLWLPALSLLMGVALGFDSLRILVTNPIGIGCLIAGLILIVLARAWTKRITTAAMGVRAAPGLREELTAIALSGGASPARARQLVDDTDIAELASGDETDVILRLSTLAGVPAVDLLRASAVAAMQRARTGARLRAAKLATRLLLPIGVCTLPAFFLLGVAPMMLSVITTTDVPL